MSKDQKYKMKKSQEQKQRRFMNGFEDRFNKLPEFYQKEIDHLRNYDIRVIERALFIVEESIKIVEKLTTTKSILDYIEINIRYDEHTSVKQARDYFNLSPIQGAMTLRLTLDMAHKFLYYQEHPDETHVPDMDTLMGIQPQEVV